MVRLVTIEAGGDRVSTSTFLGSSDANSSTPYSLTQA